MYDLYAELQEKTRQLDISVKQLRASGTSYAEAERDYNVLLRAECLKLRDEGKTIVLITHDAEVASWTDRCVHIRDGHLLTDEEERARVAQSGSHERGRT